jgi:hypothetical protein
VHIIPTYIFSKESIRKNYYLSPSNLASLRLLQEIIQNSFAGVQLFDQSIVEELRWFGLLRFGNRLG